MAEDGSRPIRLGMVGGGTGSSIGYVHRIVSRLDGDFTLVAGALSSKKDVALASGRNLGLADERIYESFLEMAKKESSREDGIEAVSIVTPNHLHFAPVKAFLEAGIHVICDKPLTSTIEDARVLAKIQAKNGAKFLLTHNYTGYPLMRKAREMVLSGQLGTLRVVQAEYAQDWLSEDISSKQADWRTDPSRSGIGGAIGDIGTHAYNILRFVTGLETKALSADLQSFVPGRKLDDNAHIMLRFAGGACGMMWVSQVAVGSANGLKLRIYGEKAAIEWSQEDPDKLLFSKLGQPAQIITRGSAAAEGEGVFTRVPGGHPEGYLEAFATLYRDFARIIRGHEDSGLLPDLSDGIEGMQFIAAAVASSSNEGKWTSFEEV